MNEFKRAHIVDRYIPTTIKNDRIPHRMQIMRTRKHAVFMPDLALTDMNALACAIALGADGVVVDAVSQSHAHSIEVV